MGIKKLFRRTNGSEEELPGRITSSTIDEHREAVLSHGRKFKYPLQYVKHKLVINTILISLVAVVAVVAFGWMQLYKFQNTGDIMYRVTRFLPLGVAEIDGQKVLYSDYLMRYRSNIVYVDHWEGTMDKKSDDTKRKIAYYKREALNYIETSSYAIKLANEYGIKISKERIKEVYDEHRLYHGSEITESSYNKKISDNYGWSRSEYERMIELMLIKQDVQAKIDENAKKIVDELSKKLKPDGTNFETIAKEYAGRVIMESSGDLVSSNNVDGGRAASAAKLEGGEVSEPFLSKDGSGYYFVKLLNRSGDKVEYLSISVPFTELDSRVETLRADGKIKELIQVESE